MFKTRFLKENIYSHNKILCMNYIKLTRQSSPIQLSQELFSPHKGWSILLDSKAVVWVIPTHLEVKTHLTNFPISSSDSAHMVHPPDTQVSSVFFKHTKFVSAWWLLSLFCSFPQNFVWLFSCQRDIRLSHLLGCFLLIILFKWPHLLIHVFLTCMASSFMFLIEVIWNFHIVSLFL